MHAPPTCSFRTTLSASCSAADDGTCRCCAPTPSDSWASVGAPPRTPPGSPSTAPPPLACSEHRTAGAAGSAGSHARRCAARAVEEAGAAGRGDRGSSGGWCSGMTHWREGTPPIRAQGPLVTVGDIMSYTDERGGLEKVLPWAGSVGTTRFRVRARRRVRLHSTLHWR